MRARGWMVIYPASTLSKIPALDRYKAFAMNELVSVRCIEPPDRYDPCMSMGFITRPAGMIGR